MQDKVDRGRSRLNRRDQTGDKNPSAFLTDEIVIEARRLATTGMSHTKVAEQLGFSKASISQAIIGKSWNHLNEIAPPVLRDVKGGGRITEAQKAEIRRLRAAGVPCKDLAAQYGCTASNISVITRKK